MNTEEKANVSQLTWKDKPDGDGLYYVLHGIYHELMTISGDQAFHVETGMGKKIDDLKRPLFAGPLPPSPSLPTT